MAVAHRRLQRIGNSTGVILSAQVLREAGLAAGDEVLVQAEKGRVVVVPFDADFDAALAAADRFISNHPNALRKLAE
jgi:putative addiction module antidote